MDAGGGMEGTGIGHQAAGWKYSPGVFSCEVVVRVSTLDDSCLQDGKAAGFTAAKYQGIP